MEISQAKQWIAEAMIQLLRNKNYHDITILEITNKAKLGRRTFYRHFKTKDEVIELISFELMDKFANKILENKATSFEMIMQSYFEFWEDEIELLLLLKKARLLYYIEDNIMVLVADVAHKIGHVPNDIDQQMALMEEYKYEFAYKLAGFWKLTLVWCEETPRKRPSEMAEIISDFIGKIR